MLKQRALTGTEQGVRAVGLDGETSDVSLAFRLLQRVQGRPTLELFEERRRSQCLSRNEIRARQLREVRRLLAHAEANVPHYRTLLSERGVRAAAIRSLDDFARLIPTIDKEQVRRNLSQLHADNADRRLIVHRTGGSSGQPLELPRDRLSVGAFWADYLLTRSWWAVAMGAPSAKIWGHYHAPKSASGKLVADAKEFVRRNALGAIFLSAYELGDEQMGRFARQLQRIRPASIYGYASALETFARFVEDTGIDLGLPASSVVISTSEPLLESQKELFRRALAKRVANEYGSCEAGLLAFDCPAGRMHILEDTSLVEVLDAEGRSLEQGVGEVVLTSLCNYSVPLIRYRLGDVARLSTEVCTCGRRGRLLEAIEGRTWSMLRGTNGKEVYPQVVTQIVVGLAPEARRFQAVQDRVDHVSIKLAAPRGIAPERTRSIADELARMMGPGACVDVEVVDRIDPERSGKFVPVKYLVASST